MDGPAGPVYIVFGVCGQGLGPTFYILVGDAGAQGFDVSISALFVAIATA